MSSQRTTTIPFGDRPAHAQKSLGQIFALPSLALLATLLGACSSSSPPGEQGADVDTALQAGGETALTSEVTCPDDMPAVDLDTAPEYDSWLSMKGGAYGHIQREWHNGCSQQLSFPASAEDNAPYNEPQGDYKPVHSPDGEHIAFFRRYYAFEGTQQEILTVIGDNIIPNWVTGIMMMNADDGSNLRALTQNDDYLYVNPHWTRRKFPNQSGGQGYRITFTRALRHADEDEGGDPNAIPRTGVAEPGRMCWIDIDSEVNTERCFTEAGQAFFGYSSLKDGRILARVEATRERALVTPNENDPSQTKIEVLDYQPGGVMGMPILHKITISPDETKIAYMKVDPELMNAGSATAFGFAVIAYADLDTENLTISNEVNVTEFNPANIEWYPSWSPTNKQLIWFCSGNCPYWDAAVPVNYYTDNSQVVEHDLDTGEKRRISHELTTNYRYPDIWGTVK